jgi:hypothetical protein
MVIWAHGDLAGCEQRPEQQRGGSGRGQRGLGLDPALERFVQRWVGTSGQRLARARSRPPPPLITFP